MRSPKAKRERRQERAIERTAARAERSDYDQLKRLEKRGDGHCDEALRLREILARAA